MVEKQHPRAWIVSITMIAIAFLFSVALLFATSDILSDERNTLLVAGNSEEEVTPDEFSLRVGVSETGSDVNALEEDVSSRMNEITSQLRALGLDDDELQTSSFTVREEYSSMPREEGRTQEYRVTQQLSIESDQIDLVAQIIDVSLDAGANSVSSLRFQLSDEVREEQRNLLLAEAIEKAEEKAEIAAQASGSSVVGVAEMIVDDYSHSPYRVTQSFDESMDAAGDLPSIEEGTVSVSASVQIKYKIN